MFYRKYCIKRQMLLEGHKVPATIMKNVHHRALKLKNTSWRLFGGMVLAGYVGALALTVSGCATPIGVTRGSTQEIYRALTANVLSAGEPSTWSKQVLHRNNLT